ncbi:serine/threonine protein kinase [Gigaspora margarita]|uniref:Serine/threonine protein kinase n=1 Tax=Gigaspora margarita TaxID=4874 RepID=A0A8H4B307_GIGMA|nr:serine/threonine protein kinase [Gigaspora margarita]
MKWCWDPNPSERPSATEVFMMINDWIENFDKDHHGIKFSYIKDAIKEFKEHDKLKMSTLNNESDPIYIHHPQSYSTSRIIRTLYDEDKEFITITTDL